MLLRASFIIIFHFVWTTWTLQCPKCDQTLPLTSSEMINTNRSECNPIDAEHSSCSQLLHIRYLKENAYVLFEPSPSESLVLSNAEQIMKNTTMIWLNKVQFERTFQILCFHTNACTTDAINRIYAEGRLFQYSELWANLVTRLYNAPTTNSANLLCADNQDKPVPCPYGFCQLISIDSSSFSRSCVLNGSIANPYGVILESKTISATDIQSSVMYTCNIPMCNNSTMVKEVRQLLEARELLMHSMTTTTTTTTTSTTTTSTTTTTTKRSTGNTIQSMVSIQFGLLLLIICVFQH